MITKLCALFCCKLGQHYFIDNTHGEWDWRYCFSCQSIDTSTIPLRKRIVPMFAWYDLWIGVFIKRPSFAEFPNDPTIVYIFPLPMLGIKLLIGGHS